jgi:hypothetical protein
MGTPAQQRVFSGKHANNSTCSSSAYLYADMQHAGAGKAPVPQCRIPRAPITPRPLNQAQQRNVVRQWMGLPPIESNWQRASRQAGQTANAVLKIAEQSLGQVTSLVGAAWNGMRGFSGTAFIAGLPSLHIGFPGAAASASGPILKPAPNPPIVRPPQTPSASFPSADCSVSSRELIGFQFGLPENSTVEELLAACPDIRCRGDATGPLHEVTVIVESGAEAHTLAMSLAARGAQVFLSAEAVEALGEKRDCLETWFNGSYARLDDVNPGDWAPETGGSVVLLSSREFAGRLADLRNVSYPSCNAAAYTCPPSEKPSVPAPEPGAVSEAVHQPSPGAAPMPQSADGSTSLGLGKEDLARALIGPAALIAVGIIGGVYICLSHAYEATSTSMNDAEISLSEAITHAPVPMLPVSAAQPSDQPVSN